LRNLRVAGRKDQEVEVRDEARCEIVLGAREPGELRGYLEAA
jgi:hypothetical protein